MLKRWLLFLKDRFAQSAFFLALGFASVDLFTQRVLAGDRVQLTLQSLMVAICSTLLIAILRINDEVKDLEYDRVFSPERPLPAGRISVRDLFYLALVCLALALTPPLVWPWARLEFLSALLFLVLVTQSYFLPRGIFANRFLLVASGLPLYFCLYLFCATASARALDLSGAAWTRFAIAGSMLLPLLSFEVARKTVLPRDERDGYETYSRILGLKAAVSLSFALALGHFLVLSTLSQLAWRLPPWMLIGFAALLVYFAWTAWRFGTRQAKSSADLAVCSSYYSLGVTVLFILSAFI